VLKSHLYNLSHPLIHLAVNMGSKKSINNIMRKFALKLIEKFTHGFHCIKKYLEYVMDNITFRILYDRITLPIKIYYKDLKKRHG